MNISFQAFMDEVIAKKDGKPITRKHTISIEGKKFMEKQWPAIVSYIERKGGAA